MIVSDFNGGVPTKDWRIVANDSVKDYDILHTRIEDEHAQKDPVRMIAVIVAAGPSLDKNGEELKLLDDSKAAIFCVDAAWKWFVKHSLEHMVDYVVVKEEGQRVDRFFQNTKPAFGQSMICAHTTHLSVKREWDASIYQYLNWQNNPGVRNRWGEIRPNAELPLIESLVENVSFHALEVAAYMGFQKFVTVGLDMGMKDTQHTHCSDSPIDAPRQKVENYLRVLRRDARQQLEKPENHHIRDAIVNCTEGGFFDFVDCQPLKDTLERLRIRV